ncbi:disease resistance protein RUN1-like [Gastrolobium bilobum]|uniref:disease resistance protein RUN1-like n=1 Tax=Gastrolobium bilobum TaxID=150636 RepID=UPI002AB2E961|nr:disease resistance protein RUN1-like [Gastrolobium bilobum]XP_061353228.1 disease resistance protein RUN1-like [Gastrolobium bilobum]
MDSRKFQSSKSSQRICKYDVFISFRGTDTRNSFVDHLFAHLSRKGLFAFKDDKRLDKGEPISAQLLQAIHDSRVSIVVFSPDYASSTWCLDEMASINECRKNLQQTVFPIFYEVDPSHVRNHQKGVYKDAFLLHTTRFEQDQVKVNRWERAMKDLAGLAGWDVRNKPESKEIENIVHKVISILGHKFSGFVVDEVIGMQPRVATLESILELSSPEDKFRVLGIWGMSGIGKTTLASALYDRISYQFDACCFIGDVSKIYGDGGAVAVQKQILRQTLKEEDVDKCSPLEISGIITYRFHKIKVLVVLDNVDESKQLRELSINPKLLRAGSRMIVTTRDEHILKAYGTDIVYEAQLMKDNDARQLLCRKAFKSDDSSSNFVELIPEILKYAKGLPLVISVLGSFLCTRDAPQWIDALDRLKKNPDKDIMDVLRLSFDGLQDDEKEIFLHIACFFKGERVDYVKRVLDACGLYPGIGIQRLIETSLIIIKNQKIHMHEMLQELGKHIVRQQFPQEPGLWSRLWLYLDFYYVLMTKTGTDEVKAIVLDQKDAQSPLTIASAEGLSKMTSLRLLILNHMKISGDLNFLSNSLQYLMWRGYPFTSLPSNFEPYRLVELNLRNSSIHRLWDGRKDLPILPFLKRIDLSNSKNLMETPVFDGIPELERLDLTGCTNLHHVDSSIGILSKLAFLSLQNCSNLVGLDFGSSSNLSSMRIMELSGCTKLENMPDFTGASNLEYLDIDQCSSLSAVHESIGTRTKLRFLSCRDCTSLVSIPSKVYTIESLKTLDCRGCLILREFPRGWFFYFSVFFPALILLDLGFCNLSEVPEGIGELKCLERLNLEGNNFVSLPSTIAGLERLAYLNLAHCHELQFLLGLPVPWGSDSSVGSYFKTESGSRDHRSGLYIFDCPKLDVDEWLFNSAIEWLRCLIKEPRHFRCGFDIVIPWDWKIIDSSSNQILPEWFGHQFNEASVKRIEDFDVNDNWNGFAFCVAFEVNNHNAIAGSPDSSSLSRPHHFYLSFESEFTEECFDMPLSLELNKIDGSKYLWIIYISREHCHFVKTGARITFKARPGLMMKQWGLRMVVTKYLFEQELHFVINNVEESSLCPEIQLPYNWLVTEEEEVENHVAKEKENKFSNLGL